MHTFTNNPTPTRAQLVAHAMRSHGVPVVAGAERPTPSRIVAVLPGPTRGIADRRDAGVPTPDHHTHAVFSRVWGEGSNLYEPILSGTEDECRAAARRDDGHPIPSEAFVVTSWAVEWMPLLLVADWDGTPAVLLKAHADDPLGYLLVDPRAQVRTFTPSGRAG